MAVASALGQGVSVEKALLERAFEKEGKDEEQQGGKRTVRERKRERERKRQTNRQRENETERDIDSVRETERDSQRQRKTKR